MYGMTLVRVVLGDSFVLDRFNLILLFLLLGKIQPILMSGTRAYC